MSKSYVLMDGRAVVDVDKASVMVAGSAQECCDAANSGDYGGGCIVVDPETNEPVWEWFANERWEAKKK